MKKYILPCLLFAFAPLAVAQNVNRSTVMPGFFIPDNALKTENKTENLAPAPTRAPTQKPTTIRTATAVQNSANINNQPATTPSSTLSGNIITKILQKQMRISPHEKEEYKQSILRSYSLTPQQLKNILQNELAQVNKETVYIRDILSRFNTMPPAYRLANYQFVEQMSNEITANRKRYKKLKEKFNKIIDETPSQRSIYLIEAKSNKLWASNIWDNLKDNRQDASTLAMSASHGFTSVSYISLFDFEYNHLLSYYRQRSNVLQNRRIRAADSANNFAIPTYIVNLYQNLFDEYVNDLNRVGKGLDINNPNLLRQLGEMEDKFIEL